MVKRLYPGFMTLLHKTLAFGLLIGAPMFASSINVDFGTPDAGFVQSTSTSANYTFASPNKIAATGYHVNGNSTVSPTALFAKTNGGDEEGLGLANGTDDEITPGNFIQLDLSQLTTYGAVSFTVKTNSTTGNDAFALFLSSTKGSIGSFYTAGNTETTYSFTAAQFKANPYLSLTATSGNVLLGPGTIASAPEPGTILSLGAGLVLVGLRARKFVPGLRVR